MGLSSPYRLSHFISPLRARQLHRALKNLKLTMICGLLTILVLRGALGAGKFGTPAKDFEEIKHQFERVQSLHVRKHASRVFTEVVEEKHRPQEAIETQVTHSTYDVSEDDSILNTDELQGKYELTDGDFDVQFTFDLMKPYALSPKFSDWDAQRRDWLRKNTNLVVVGKAKMMLVTGYHPYACENLTGDHYPLKFIKNKIDYCKLHGIEILYNSAFLKVEMSGFWAKLHLLRKVMLTHPEIEWFWWMDSDAMFSDMAFELPMEKYTNYNVVLHGWDDMVYKQKNWVGLTSGSFLIRNCQWSLNMLEPEDEAGKHLAKRLAGRRRSNSEADDQSEFAHLLINENKSWGDKVPFEQPIYLHGYWKIPVAHSEEKMGKNDDDVGGKRRPFMTQFVRTCKLCKKGRKKGDNNADICFKNMERAFDSADSQVLQLNSFQHKCSSSSALRRLRGGHNSIVVPHSDVLPSSANQSMHTTH